MKHYSKRDARMVRTWQAHAELEQIVHERWLFAVMVVALIQLIVRFTKG